MAQNFIHLLFLLLLHSFVHFFVHVHLWHFDWDQVQWNDLPLPIAFEFDVVLDDYPPVPFDRVVLLFEEALLEHFLHIVEGLQDVIRQHSIGQLQLEAADAGGIHIEVF